MAGDVKCRWGNCFLVPTYVSRSPLAHPMNAMASGEVLLTTSLSAMLKATLQTVRGKPYMCLLFFALLPCLFGTFGARAPDTQGPETTGHHY